jgi:biotin-(acetyl-CoA carboxylase) ligase
MILKSIKNMHQHMKKYGFSAMLDEINAAWNMPRQVELTLDNGIQRGAFLGITGEGDLIVKNDSGRTYSYSPLQVKRFREV